MYDSEREYHDELSRLTDELERCRLETSQHEAVLNSLRSYTDDKIQQLNRDKAMLQVHYMSVIFVDVVQLCYFVKKAEHFVAPCMVYKPL